MAQTPEKAAKPPRLWYNFVSLFGVTIVAASFISITLLFFSELLGREEHPYFGIFTYIIFPAILILGLTVILVGMIIERRRRRHLAPEEIAAFPRIDLNDPRRRRSLVVFLVFLFVFLFVSAFGSYRAYEYTESVAFCGQLCHEVMNPEFVAYQASPHARVKCVECHVGPGAGWYVKSKLSGAYQVYSVAFKKFPRPIATPVHDLRPAQDTCEKCHWPEKFFGAQLKVFNRFGYDEKNTLSQTRMLINTGGGSPATGQVEGIHWHMNIANEITYISTDAQRQVIPYVVMKDQHGAVTEYKVADFKMTPQEISNAPKRKMDCVDCHNRPSHIYLQPDEAVNQSLIAGKLDASLPYLKGQAVEALSKDYQSTSEALSAIASGLTDYYRTRYPEIYASKEGSIQAAIGETQRIFQTYIFPEMKVDWRTHPTNIGHYYSVGCFRCHDGKHVSNTGKIIRNDCNICHTVLDQTDNGATFAPPNGSFRHPVDLGTMSALNCTACHKGGGAFQHPVKLGDISEFKCAECHKR